MTGPSELSVEERKAQEGELREVWRTPSGWRYWTSVNNTEIGLWYGSAAFLFMLFAGVLALPLLVMPTTACFAET